MISQSSTVLGIGNPFRDRSIFVEEAFIQKLQLTKGLSNTSDNLEVIEKSWKAANQGKENKSWTVAGSGLNVIKTLSRLGQSCQLCGKIGNDADGEEIEERLKKLKISCLIPKSEKISSGLINCFITPDKERTMHAYFGSSIELSEIDLKKEMFENIKHLHIEGYATFFGDVLETSISYAKKNNATISLDLATVDFFPSRFKKCIPNVDLVFGNFQEMKTLTGANSAEVVMDWFKYNQIAVLTDGANGCWVKDKGNVPVEYKAIEVKNIVDTTGAGDFFQGGFLYEFLQGKNINQCVETATLAASLVIQELGADLPEKQWENLIKQVNSSKNE